MIKIALITLATVLVVGLFIPDKYLPQKKRVRYRYSADNKGLPWMDPNYQKRKKREERNSYKF